jgi:type II secretory pathway component PulK
MSARRSERGFALVWAMVLLVLVSALSSLVLSREMDLRASTTADAHALRAHYAAEGGLAHARHALRRDPGFRTATLRVGTCDVSVRVERSGRIVSVAVSGDVRLVRESR